MLTWWLSRSPLSTFSHYMIPISLLSLLLSNSPIDELLNDTISNQVLVKSLTNTIVDLYAQVGFYTSQSVSSNLYKFCHILQLSFILSQVEPHSRSGASASNSIEYLMIYLIQS